jgi:hypothetical protein
MSSSVIADPIERFRAETRAWLQANCPPEMRRPAVTDEDRCWGGRNPTFQSATPSGCGSSGWPARAGPCRTGRPNTVARV